MSEQGGNGKYAVIGILLLLGAVGIYFATQPEPPPPPKPPPVAKVERQVNAEPAIEIPDELPDAGEPVEEEKPKTKVRYVRDKWDCSGDVPKAQAASVIRSNSRQVRNCYERRLKVNHQLQGSVTLHLRIGKDGSVSGTRTGGTLRDNEVFSCVRKVASSWKFPAPKGGACYVVSAPYNFKPKL